MERFFGIGESADRACISCKKAMHIYKRGDFSQGFSFPILWKADENPEKENPSGFFHTAPLKVSSVFSRFSCGFTQAAVEMCKTGGKHQLPVISLRSSSISEA